MIAFEFPTKPNASGTHPMVLYPSGLSTHVPIVQGEVIVRDVGLIYLTELTGNARCATVSLPSAGQGTGTYSVLIFQQHLAGDPGHQMSAAAPPAQNGEDDLLEATNRAYEALRADPAAWQAELDERAIWEVTLLDGLGDQPTEGDEVIGSHGPESTAQARERRNLGRQLRSYPRARTRRPTAGTGRL